jgi:capsid protein
MSDLKLPGPTLLDRAIGVFSPAALRARLKERVELARYEGLRMQSGSGGYDAADLRRQARANKRREGSADKAVLRDLGKLRGQSSDLVRNMPIAAGALENIATKVVGRGLELRARPDAAFLGIRPDQAKIWEDQAERLWRHFCARADYQRLYTFQMLEYVVLFSMLEHGDHFVLLTDDQNPAMSFR